MSDTEPAVVRTWLRDGTQNLMTLDHAVDNLAHNQTEGDSVDERREAIRRYLLAGRVLRTRHATFALDA